MRLNRTAVALLAGACVVALAPDPAAARPRSERKEPAAAMRGAKTLPTRPGRAAPPSVGETVPVPAARFSVPLPRPRPGGADVALRGPVPFPPPRPNAAAVATPEAPSPPPSPAQGPPPPPAPTPADPGALAACHGRLTAARADFHPLPPLSGQNGCGATDAVRLDAVRTEDGGRVTLTPAPVLRCGMAEAVANWVGQDLVPLTRGAGLKLKDLAVAGSYECRGRNRVLGARMSQHGTANAIDLRGLSFGNGASLSLTDAKGDKGMREGLARTGCGRFTTVLGPGSDGYHEDHVHFDVAERRGGYRICQWDVR